MQIAFTVMQALRKTRALVAKKGGWTQRHYARDKLGDQVSFDSHEAACFCLAGALRRVTHRQPILLREVESAVDTALHGEDIVVWNDAPDRTQKQVVALLDRAIKLEGHGSGFAKALKARSHPLTQA